MHSTRGLASTPAVVSSQPSATRRDYATSSDTSRRARLSAPVEVAGGLSTHLDDRVLRSFPLHSFLLAVGCARRRGDNRTFVIRAISTTASRNVAATHEHRGFNEVVATDLEPVVGNRCRTASWGLRVERTRSPTVRPEVPAATATPSATCGNVDTRGPATSYGHPHDLAVPIAALHRPRRRAAAGGTRACLRTCCTFTLRPGERGRQRRGPHRGCRWSCWSPPGDPRRRTGGSKPPTMPAYHDFQWQTTGYRTAKPRWGN